MNPFENYRSLSFMQWAGIQVLTVLSASLFAHFGVILLGKAGLAYPGLSTDINLQMHNLIAIAIAYTAMRSCGIEVSEIWTSPRPFRSELLITFLGYIVYIAVMGIFAIAVIMAGWYVLPLLKLASRQEAAAVVSSLPCVEHSRQWAPSAATPVFQALARFAGICILSPLAEEILYRRFLYVALRKSRGFLFSITAASVIFALFHVTEAPQVLLPGILLFWLYEKGRSLRLNILLHMLMNITAFAVHTYNA